YPAAQSANTDQPEAGARPEKILGQHIGDIGAYDTDQRRHRKMNQHRMDGVAMNGEFAGNGSGIHRDPRGFAELIAGFRSGAFFKRLAGAGLLGLCVLVSGCGGPFSALDPAGPSATAASWLWWGMFGYFTLV